MGMEYLNETKNNREKLEKLIEINGIIEVGCVNCVAIYPRIKSMDNLEVDSLVFSVTFENYIKNIKQDKQNKAVQSPRGRASRNCATLGEAVAAASRSSSATRTSALPHPTTASPARSD